MKKIAFGLLVATTMCLNSGAHAQVATKALPQAAPQATDCLRPDYSQAGRINWFLGLSPRDDLLTAWCRVQTIQGSIKFNVLFPSSQSSKTWETSFDGHLPATKIADIIQSLLPVDGSKKSSDGTDFSKVLESVAQLEAKKAPDNSDLAFAPEHPFAKELVLWEPIYIRVKPILLAGQEFTLSVKLVPNLGMLALGLQKEATDVQFEGWKGRLKLGNFFTGDCSDLIPDCKELTNTVKFHAPWVVSGVELHAVGDNMTAATLNVAQHILDSNASIVPPISPMVGFNGKTGQLVFSLNDPTSTLWFSAVGSPGGTKEITIRYLARDGEYTISEALSAIANKFRQSKPVKQEIPNVPDSTNRL